MYYLNNEISVFYKLNCLNTTKTIVKINFDLYLGIKSIKKINTYSNIYIGNFKTMNKFNIVLKQALGK